MNQKLNCNTAKQISIISFLSSIGICPVRNRGNSHWYLSPYRQEKTASFKVDAAKNSWFDFGEQRGGNLIDLGILLYRCSISRLLEILSGTGTANLAIHNQQCLSLVTEEARKLTIIKISELNHLVLLSYLKSRHINLAMVRKYCSRVDYELYGRMYYAVGFENRSGGYELRSSIHKLSSSPKDITLIKNGSKSLKVYEGFMDFLSELAMHLRDEKQFDHLVLNTTGFVNRAIPIINEYRNSFLFLDHNAAGRLATEKILKNCKNSKDASLFYSSKGDLNDYWTSQCISFGHVKAHLDEHTPGL
ncbi:MAG: toprim domain-containing protein [Bacteroidota bacterium]